jgi:hypothetical protein
MSITSETILSVQTHPGDSISKSVTGSPYKGDGYYSRSDGFHTVQYSTIDFVGVITVQATLSVNPTDADWFAVADSVYTSTNETTGSYIKNFTGNYVWLRAAISNWTNGTVSSILLNH